MTDTKERPKGWWRQDWQAVKLIVDPAEDLPVGLIADTEDGEGICTVDRYPGESAQARQANTVLADEMARRWNAFDCLVKALKEISNGYGHLTGEDCSNIAITALYEAFPHAANEYRDNHDGNPYVGDLSAEG